MPPRSRLAHAAILALIFTLASASFADDAAKLPVWKPDPKIASGLGPDFVLDNGAFRVPASFQLVKSKVLNKGNYREWHGPVEQNGLFPVLFEVSTALTRSPSAGPPTTAGYEAVEQAVLQMSYEIMSNLISDPVSSDVQHGLVDGRVTSRQYIKGFNHRWLAGIHALIYVTTTQGHLYALCGYDGEPDSKYSLPTMEASILTFHQSSQPDTPVPVSTIDQSTPGQPGQ